MDQAIYEAFTGFLTRNGKNLISHRNETGVASCYT